MPDKVMYYGHRSAREPGDIRGYFFGFLRGAGLYVTLVPVVAYGLLFLFYLPTFLKYQIPIPLMRFDISTVVLAVLGAALLYTVFIFVIALIMGLLSLVKFSPQNSSLVALLIIACSLAAVFFWNQYRPFSYIVIALPALLLAWFIYGWLRARNIKKAVEEFEQGVLVNQSVSAFLKYFDLESNSYGITHLLLIILVMLLPVIMAGVLYANDWPTFDLVDGSPRCVVIYQTTDYAICLPIDLASNQVGPEYQIIKYADNRDITFRGVYLGPLKTRPKYAAQDVLQGNYFMPPAATPAPGGE